MMSVKKTKILITGVSSPLLSRLCSRIDHNQYEVYGLTRNPRQGLPSGVRYMQGDIRDKEPLLKMLEGMEMVIHGAGVTHSQDEEPYFSVNYKATASLVDACLRKGVTRLVFISSRAARKESGAYGYSKWLAENYIRDHLKEWLIFRPSEIFGGGSSEGIDRLIQDVRSKRIIPCPIGLPSPLFPIHVDDAAELIHQCVFRFPCRNGIVFINGNRSYTYRSLIQNLAEVFCRNIVIFPIPGWVMRVIGTLQKWSLIRLRITPDQISRLYSLKGHKEWDAPFKGIEDYARDLDDT